MHLTKVWRSGSIGIWVSHPVLPLPFHLFQNGFLGSLYAFYVYWFWFIVLFIGRILFSSHSSSVEDPREAAASPEKRNGHLRADDSDSDDEAKARLMKAHAKKKA